MAMTGERETNGRLGVGGVIRELKRLKNGELT